MQITAPNPVEGAAMASVAPAAVSASGGDGNPSPGKHFDDVLTAAIAERPSPADGQSSPANGTNLPNAGKALPDTILPVTILPNTTVLNATLPNTTLPNTTLPNTTLPSTTLPDATLPNTTLPNTTLPSTTLPNSTLPDTHADTSSSSTVGSALSDASVGLVDPLKADAPADDAVSPDAAGIAASILFAPVGMPVVDSSTTSNLVATAQSSAPATLTGAHALHELTAALAKIMNEPQAPTPTGVAAAGSGPSTVAPSVVALKFDSVTPASSDAPGQANNGAVVAADATIALQVFHASAADSDGGANRQDAGQTNQSTPPVADTRTSTASRGTLQALADSFAQGQPTDIAANLAHRIQWMTQHGLQLARVAVTPRELGPIDIQLSQIDGALSVSINAQHPATRDLLDASANRLREMFASDGVALQRFDVGGGERGPGEHAYSWSAPDGGAMSIDETLPEAPPVRIALSLLDAYA